PGPVQPALDRVARAAGPAPRAVHGPDATAPPPPAVPRHVGVAALDRPHHVPAARDGRPVRVRLRRRAGGPRGPRRGVPLRPVLALSGALRGVRGPARAAALPRRGEGLEARGDDPLEERQAAPPPLTSRSR